MRHLTWDDVGIALNGLIDGRIAPDEDLVYGVPRGGAIVAGLLRERRIAITDDPAEATLFVDDILDSGATQDRWRQRFPYTPFETLIDKHADFPGEWIHFPWEADPSDDIQDHIRRILQYIGEDPAREDLLETPARMVSSWAEIFAGYGYDMDLKWFHSNTTGLVVLRNIDVFSMCEHHFLPFIGQADVGYVPNGRVVGVSKLARLVNAKARRLQIQERLTHEIGEALTEGGVQGAAVLIRSQHMCVSMRGVRQGDATMTTSYYSGVLEGPLRDEFLRGVRS